MLGNDIDNGVPPRCMVHVSCAFTPVTTIRKVLLVVPSVSTTYQPSYPDIAYFRRWSDRGVIVEAFHYSDDGYPADEMFDQLDGLSHPFKRLQEFKNVKNLSDFLAYSPDVVAVVDPLHPMAFGSKSRGL